MIWLRRLLFRRIVKGFEHRLESLSSLMKTASEHRSILYDKIEALGEPDHNNEKSLAVYREEIATWDRIYYDAFIRHEEVESGLMHVLKDYDRR